MTYLNTYQNAILSELSVDHYLEKSDVSGDTRVDQSSDVNVLGSQSRPADKKSNAQQIDRLKQMLGSTTDSTADSTVDNSIDSTVDNAANVSIPVIETPSISAIPSITTKSPRSATPESPEANWVSVSDIMPADFAVLSAYLSQTQWQITLVDTPNRYQLSHPKLSSYSYSSNLQLHLVAHKKQFWQLITDCIQQEINDKS